jgi:hypothetical protein
MDVLALRAAADVVDLTNFALAEDRIDATAMVRTQ